MQLIVRMEAAQATFNKFYGKAFQWGKRDCVHLCSYALQELGYDDPLAEIKHYNTLLGARKAMKRAGVSSFEEYLDRLFERIAPAMALPSDIIALPSDVDGMSALGIAIGEGRVLAYPEGMGCAFGPHDECTAAWRVPPMRSMRGAV